MSSLHLLDAAKDLTNDVEDINCQVRDNFDMINGGLAQMPEG